MTTFKITHHDGSLDYYIKSEVARLDALDEANTVTDWDAYLEITVEATAVDDFEAYHTRGGADVIDLITPLFEAEIQELVEEHLRDEALGRLAARQIDAHVERFGSLSF